ncbi:MAG: hypothetical protein HY748_10885 [Elusimicrobia bacterium]|nr:hypothetical protein [Elusimicrobiota bacterium]
MRFRIPRLLGLTALAVLWAASPAGSATFGQDESQDLCAKNIEENLFQTRIYPEHVRQVKPLPFEALGAELCGKYALSERTRHNKSSRATLEICALVRDRIAGYYPSILYEHPVILSPRPSELDYDQADVVFPQYCGKLTFVMPTFQAHWAGFFADITRRQWLDPKSAPTEADEKLLRDIGGRLVLNVDAFERKVLETWRKKLDEDNKQRETLVNRIIATRSTSKQLGSKYQRLSPQQLQSMAGWLREDPGGLGGYSPTRPLGGTVQTGDGPSGSDLAERQRKAIEEAKRQGLAEEKRRSEIMRALDNQKILDDIPRKDGVYEHWDIATTPEEFLNFFATNGDLKYDKRGGVLNKLPNDIVPMEEIRYVPDPKTGKLIDMRHFLVVGSCRTGTSWLAGRFGEVLQGFQSIFSLQLSAEDRKGLGHSSFHEQDLFSNDLGAEFFQDERYAEGNGKTLLENLRQFFIDRGAKLP